MKPTLVLLAALSSALLSAGRATASPEADERPPADAAKKPVGGGLLLALEGTRQSLHEVPFDALALGIGGGIRGRRLPWLSLNPMGSALLGRTASGLRVTGLAANFGADFLLPSFHIEPNVGPALLLFKRVTKDESLVAIAWTVGLRAGPELAIGDAGHLAIDATAQLSVLGDWSGLVASYGLRLRHRFY